MKTASWLIIFLAFAMISSGEVMGDAGKYVDFYTSIRDQVMIKWQNPGRNGKTTVSPIVQIHVEKDGRVPMSDVRLIRSSGDPTFDNSALAAAKTIGDLHQPLPDGCSPDIPITFELTN
jgi:TonB family protein